MRNLQHYITIQQAARLLGVSPSTLRAWDRAGKFVAVRNPMNHYRLYRREDVEGLLTRIERTASAKTPPKRSQRKDGAPHDRARGTWSATESVTGTNAASGCVA